MAITAYVNLTSREVEYQPSSQELLGKFLGGRGYAARLLFDRVGPETQPFDPENCLIFSTGSLNATPWPTSSRYHVTFKSPATGAYGYANSGGHFGPELRKAGFDAIVITGKAAEPAILKITNEHIEILPAKDLWGKTTSEVEKILRSSGGGRVASIGPAGEHLSFMAGIINDFGRAAARTGGGAVMGSKNLKAIHVIASGKLSASPAEFTRLVKQTSRLLIEHQNSQGLMNESTLFLMEFKNVVGDLPAKNHQLGQAPFINNLDAHRFSQYWIDRKGCEVCPIRCARTSEVKSGPYASRIEGPEYETADALGPLVWNSDPELVIKANELCNDYGLDTISVGATIAFAMECHEKGLLHDAQFSLEWGDPVSILGLIKAIAYREGCGDLLSDGTLRAARKLGPGASRFAIQVKGVELPRQEPRISKGFGLGHATGNRGADHLYGLPTIDLAGNWERAIELFPAEMHEKLMDVADETYKADILIYGEHFCAVADSLGLCKFSTSETYVVMPDEIAAGLRALGYDFTGEQLLEAGERIVNLERMYNVRHGFGRDEDQLPERFTQESLEIYTYTFNPQTQAMDRSEKPAHTGRIYDFQAMLDRYYSLRGWEKSGAPTPATLQRLGLADCASAIPNSHV
ncbi:MAG: aldehyde ferredoxin oxidoreductase family protein [Anaerolineaceae bacterium]|nr:aldehyde ferredoxin oxidoreductase family protein [Anaerolineaceae bacterium]